MFQIHNAVFTQPVLKYKWFCNIHCCQLQKTACKT